MVSVAEAAHRLGVNVQRVHRLIADGSLPAERVGHQWAIEEADLARSDRHPAGRPLSAQSAWLLAKVAEIEVRPEQGRFESRPESQAPDAARVSAPQRSRARARYRQLVGEARQGAAQPDQEAAAEQLAALLRGLLRRRADRQLFRCSPLDPEELRSDPRVRPSGLSLSASGIASGDVVEGYVARADLESLVDDFLLSEARPEGANVVIHVIAPELPAWLVQPEYWLILAVDLAEHHGPREVARAAQIVRDVLAQAPSRMAGHDHG